MKADSLQRHFQVTRHTGQQATNPFLSLYKKYNSPSAVRACVSVVLWLSLSEEVEFERQESVAQFHWVFVNWHSRNIGKLILFCAVGGTQRWTSRWTSRNEHSHHTMNITQQKLFIRMSLTCLLQFHILVYLYFIPKRLLWLHRTSIVNRWNDKYS